MRISFRFLLFFITSVVLSACSSEPASLLVSTPTRVFIPTPLSSPAPTTNATALPTATTTPTRALLFLSTPTNAPAVVTTPTRATTTAAGKMTIKLYFVAIGDNGKSGKKIGCNDSIIAVDRAIPVTQAPLTAAFNELFSLHDKTYGESGLYNALYNANLKMDSAAVVNGMATINVSGTLGLGGECDDPRVKAQLEELALQFTTVKQTQIFLNNIAIEKALSGKGN